MFGKSFPPFFPPLLASPRALKPESIFPFPQLFHGLLILPLPQQFDWVMIPNSSTFSEELKRFARPTHLVLPQFFPLLSYWIRPPFSFPSPFLCPQRVSPFSIIDMENVLPPLASFSFLLVSVCWWLSFSLFHRECLHFSSSAKSLPLQDERDFFDLPLRQCVILTA